MKFNTPYERSQKNLDAGGGEIIVELAGYIPVQRRIKEMMDAGKRLVEHRTAEAYYHYSTGEDPDLEFWDPTLERGYDPADASMQSRAVKYRLNAQKKAAEEAAKTSPETPPSEGIKDNKK